MGMASLTIINVISFNYGRQVFHSELENSLNSKDVHVFIIIVIVFETNDTGICSRIKISEARSL